MMILQRFILLALFVAIGVGFALFVGISIEGTLDGPQDELTTEVALSTASEPPRPTNAYLPPTIAYQPTIAIPAGPFVAEPHPARTYQFPSEADASRVMETLEAIREHLPTLSLKDAPSPTAPSPPEFFTVIEEETVGTLNERPDVVMSEVPSDPEPVVGELIEEIEPAAELPIDNVVSAHPPMMWGEGDDELVMHFRQDDIREVLEMLSEQGDLNILATDSVQGTVTATLNGVDIESALDAILRSTGYVARRDGDFIYVGSPSDFDELEQSADRITTRVYRPNYVSAVELTNLITPLLTQGAGQVGVSQSSPSEVGIDAGSTGGDSFAAGEVVLVRDYEAVLFEIDQIVAEVDIRPMQVAIETMILSVKLDDENSLGASFELLRNNPDLKFGINSPPTALPTSFPKGGVEFAFIDSTIGAFLNALEQIKDTNVIATPRVMVLNKQRAEIQIGRKEGYVSNTTNTETSSSETVEFLDTGTLLRLRPFISRDGMIRLEVHPELSSGEVKEKGNFTLPEKDVTQVTTNIMVRDGRTVIIGGLIREQIVNNTSQIPLFGSLPLVGPIFRTTKEETAREEILVLLTPHIIYESEAGQEGNKAAGEFHRRHEVYKDKTSVFSKRAIARRYVRMAQNAWLAGDGNAALRFAELAVHFDPLSREAIDLRSDIWVGNQAGDHTLGGPVINGPHGTPLDGQQIAPWILDGLQSPGPEAVMSHPRDLGVPGPRRDIERTRSFQ